jgi:hypothetical protein
MTLQDLMVLLSPIAPILVASAWLHGSLSKITTKIEVALARLTTHDERINRLENRIERIERTIQGDNS